MKKIVILGSTGSIGRQTLEVVRSNPDHFKVVGLSANKNAELFDVQCKEFLPKYFVLTSKCDDPQSELEELARLSEADLIVNAITGIAGLYSTLAAVSAGKKLALANKESIVMAGELVMDLVRKNGAEILPIDSEPSAIWQALFGRDICDVEKITLTASGGPFWGRSREALKDVTPKQAVAHPTWSMGEKISVDSATLINKGFEIIETRWLFDFPCEKIDVSIHKQSLVHALVHFNDGNVSAVMSPSDMRVPISHALFYPQRSENKLPRVDFSKLSLSFEEPDYSVFEGVKIAYDVLKQGGVMPAVFCMADEIAVNKFLRGEIGFLQIFDEVKRALERVKNRPLNLEALIDIQNEL